MNRNPLRRIRSLVSYDMVVLHTDFIINWRNVDFSNFRPLKKNLGEIIIELLISFFLRICI